MTELSIYCDNPAVAIGTLAAKTGILQSLKQDGSRNQGFRFMKTECYVGIEGQSVDDALLICGITGPAMDLTELEEALEADPQSPYDQSPQDEANRPYWIIGALTPKVDKIFMKLNMKWSFPEETGMSFFVYNASDVQCTTGAVVNAFLKHYGVWLRD